MENMVLEQMVNHTYSPGKTRPMNDGYETDGPGTHGSENNGPGKD